MIARFTYGRYRGFNDSVNEIKTLTAMDNNGNPVGNEVIFTKSDFDEIFNTPVHIRDYSIVERLNFAILNWKGDNAEENA